MHETTLSPTHRLRSRLAAAGLLASLLLPAGELVAQAGPGSAPPTEEEILERILELEREIERLTEHLSPEARQLLAERRAAAEEAASAEPTAPQPPATGRTCNLLEPFDSDGDGQVSGRDRAWRYLALWRDADGDATPEAAELTHPYDAGVRAIAVDLETFQREDRSRGRVTVGSHVVLELDAGRFAPPAILAVETGRVGRFGPPRLLGPDGEALEGTRPLRPGWRFEAEDGTVTVLACR